MVDGAVGRRARRTRSSSASVLLLLLLLMVKLLRLLLQGQAEAVALLLHLGDAQLQLARVLQQLFGQHRPLVARPILQSLDPFTIQSSFVNEKKNLSKPTGIKEIPHHRDRT